MPAGGTHWMCHQQSLAPCRCPTVPGMSHLAQHLKASTCGQKASERQQLPRNWLLGPAQAPTCPLVPLPTPCSGPGLSPAQNGDFVWHLVLETLLGLFLWHGTCRAGLQKHDTRSDAPSTCCFCFSLLPFTDQLPPSSPSSPGGLFPSLAPQVASKGGTSQEVFTCPLHLLLRRTASFLPE